MRYFIKFAILLFFSCQNPKPITLPETPTIAPEPVTQNYWGTSVSDEYRNLEATEDSSVQTWYKAQGAYANAVFDRISGRDEFIEKIKAYDKEKGYYVSRFRKGIDEQYFYLKLMAGDAQWKLYYRASKGAEEELLYDPQDFRPETGRTYDIKYIYRSWDGRYVAVSLSYEGREFSEMIIIDVKNRKPLPQVIDHCLPISYFSVRWLHDDSGFIYTHYPNIDKNSKDYKKYKASVLYKIGQDPKQLNVLLSANNNPELQLNPDYTPRVDVHINSNSYAIAYVTHVGKSVDAYYAPLEAITRGKKIQWKPLFTQEDQVYRYPGIIQGENFIFKSVKNAPNFQLAKVNLKQPDFQNPEILVAERPEEVIKDYAISADGLFYTTVKNGIEAKFYHQNKQGEEKEIPLPQKSGASNVSSLGVDYRDLGISVEGWTTPYRYYQYDLETNTFSKYPNTSPVVSYPAVDNMVVKEVMVTSHDGVEVPLSIIHKKGIEKNGKHPTLLYGYGAYGRTRAPYFSPYYMAWVEEGGIYCIAHVRGGGEKGEAWHKAGFKTTKPNTWKDLIACTEYMIDEGYTSNKHTVIEGTSAGGIMVGRAMTERPDLFAVVIGEVAAMNMLRLEAANMGSNYKEFGSVKDSTETMGLIAMDPYLHLKQGGKYPATVFTTGMNDPRVPPWMTGKFVAKLQAYDASDTPNLFIVNYKGGHQSGTADAAEREWANICAFAFWQTGHPKYQYREKE